MIPLTSHAFLCSIDEAYTLGMAKARNKAEAGIDAINEVIRNIDAVAQGNEEGSFPLIILAGFPQEMQNFLAAHGALR